MVKKNWFRSITFQCRLVVKRIGTSRWYEGYQRVVAQIPASCSVPTSVW